ncbi:iron chelate uptake ABC transporter family permease subunit [Paenibacillus sp. LHD-117]|uniref:FecCD family ABC transporter permease n=1 Tax=Paenibacillus sp. LHD-117 TaxID=3071412 RepID=UPI0027DEFE31|nr:iron chelate uptake ABC transporter family permease subunit [Paenibacillus sp. LHD-117]MDQ6420129.1 iron chelate uptake ABC transporter family permease subunit [Paenibacillus sp. LHD-117]
MKRMVAVLISFLLFLSLAAISLQVGAVPVPLRELWASLTFQDSPASYIVLQYRLPRVIIAALAGFGLAAAGAILQSIIRNPLASPDVIGITKGAGFTAAAVIFLFPGAPSYVLPVAAFAGAFGALLILVLLSRRMTLSPASFALVGVAVGAVFQAGIQYLLVKHPSDVNMALLWMSGSLWGRGWDHVGLLLPWIAVLLPVAWLNYGKLNVFQLGDEGSSALGLNVPKQRLLLLLLAVALTGSSVAAVGSIGFVGLIAPHIARLLVGGRHQWLLPLAALIGADLMLIGDIVGRVLIIPREVPVGITTAVIGAPYFIYLLRRERLKAG